MQNEPIAPLFKVDNTDSKEPSKKSLGGCLSFVAEYYRERLPHECEGGTILTKERKATPKAENILIFADSGRICPNDRTGAEGFMDDAPLDREKHVKVVSTPPSEISMEAMIQEVDSGFVWDIIVFGYGCENVSAGCEDVNEVIKLQDKVMLLLLGLSQHLILKKYTNRLAILTCGALSIEPEEHKRYGISLITHANLLGFANTLRLEASEMFRVQYVDCPKDYPQMDIDIASEILREEGFGTNNVRLNPPGPHEGAGDDCVEGRFVQRLQTMKPYEARKVRWLLPEKGTVIITGGNGSLGLIMGKWILSKAQRSPYNHPLKILFVSRSMKLNDDDGEAMWSDIVTNAKQLGIEVEQVSCDFSNQQSCNSFIAQHSPNICGIIHSAGVLRDSLLVNQTSEKFQDVFNAKSHAALYIHEALMSNSNPSLYFFWLFSSTATMGSPGQSNYSSSNAMLDGIARHRRALGLPCCAVAWGPWGEAGMAKKLTGANWKRLNVGPYPFFTNVEGLQGLEEGLKSDLPAFFVYKLNVEMMLGGQDMEPTNATKHFQQNFNQKIAPPSYFDQCGCMSLKRNWIAPSKILMAPRFTYNEYPNETGESYEETSDCM